MKTSAEKRMTFMPNPGESVGAWANRFLTAFSVLPTDAHLSATGMPWVQVTIATSADGVDQTPKLHKALGFLNGKYPPDEIVDTPYMWTGKLTFWFSDADEAVLFKLALPNL
jgi:hypothetical protein